ncbi:MAG: type I pullulanase [Bacilli bacterium]|nr:type I pullulanase [Bacilli bacterium]MBO4682898.1 type I pullulanase [Bacilli bacterium]
MKNSFIKAQLTGLKTIQVLVFTNVPRTNDISFTVFKDPKDEGQKARIAKQSGSNLVNIFELELPENYEFGKQYYVGLTSFNPQPVDVNNAIYFPEFEELFNYHGDDLGAIYYKDRTEFAVWAPLATKVVLKIAHGKDDFEYFTMRRTAKGVYRHTLIGDQLNLRYSYLVTNDGVTRESTDPYAKGASTNSFFSAVVDYESVKKMPKIAPKNIIKNYVDAVIYEVGVRDFTEQNNKATNIVNKGKYLGFVEENRKTAGGHPAGLDYLKNLGITHVQLNPVIDFGTVDDVDMNKKYNWGYDPISMFALEGSYSLRPDIPQERLVEYRTMINKLHKANIRVIMDVVYNHTYNYLTSCYEKIVPQFYFRRAHNGVFACASGCGNDFASEKYMVRKMITDSLKYFVDVFDVDGFRFDLMGLTDIETINKGVKDCRRIKKDLMFYGEGWNMGDLPFEKKACTDNAKEMPDVGFFNDTYRDIIKGATFDKGAKGYVGGDINYAFGMKYALTGSTIDFNYNARFIDANQSINYAECHDNNTLFDKLTFSNPDEDEKTLLERVRLTNGIIATSIGVPFYHMGQEIGQSKKGLDNTYNVLGVNKMDWRLIDERYEMVNYLKAMIAYRNNLEGGIPHTKGDIQKGTSIYERDGGMFLEVNDLPKKSKYEKQVVCVNPTTRPIEMNPEDRYELVVGIHGMANPKQTNKNLIVSIPPLATIVIGQRRK